MDVSEYVEALEALNECCDNPLMVEPLTWTTAIQGWQERASITRDLADRVADDALPRVFRLWRWADPDQRRYRRPRR